MRRARLAVTSLDQMIWFERLEDMTTQDLIDRFLHRSEPSFKMLAGIAWHKVLETQRLVGAITMDGIDFSVDFDGEVEMPQIKELRGQKDYQIDDILVTLAGRCDGISGNRIIDHKTSFNPSIETHMESYQWRAYLDIFNAQSFTYYVYHAKQDRLGVIRIVDVNSYTFYRYPGMEKDIERGIRDVLEFMKEHIPQKIQESIPWQTK